MRLDKDLLEEFHPEKKSEKTLDEALQEMIRLQELVQKIDIVDGDERVNIDLMMGIMFRFFLWMYSDEFSPCELLLMAKAIEETDHIEEVENEIRFCNPN